MKKVLIITYYWPPSGGSGVQRWLKFSKYLRNFGWEPIIYTPDNPGVEVVDKSFQKDIIDSLTVVKTKIWEPFEIYKVFTGRKKDNKLGVGFLSEKKGISTKDKLATWIRGNFFIPDARFFWIKPSVKFLKRYLNENPVDIIVSTGPPHSMHLIALGLKNKLNIPWVADFRDPWTDIDFYDQLKLTKWADKKHHLLEKKVFTNADKIVSVSWSWARDYEKNGAKNVEVITNGFDPDDFPIMTDKILNDQFLIFHFGSVNKDRNHEIFWKAISELVRGDKNIEKKLKIVFVGSLDYTVSDSIVKYNLESKVERIEYMPHNEAIELAYKSTILYLPLNNTSNVMGIIPGKIFEYLALKKPILCIGTNKGDTARIIRETQSGKVFSFSQKDEVKQWLKDRFYKSTDSYMFESNACKIKKFSRVELTKEMAALFDSFVNR